MAVNNTFCESPSSPCIGTKRWGSTMQRNWLKGKTRQLFSTGYCVAGAHSHNFRHSVQIVWQWTLPRYSTVACQYPFVRCNGGTRQWTLPTQSEKGSGGFRSGHQPRSTDQLLCGARKPAALPSHFCYNFVGLLPSNVYDQFHPAATAIDKTEILGHANS